MVGVCNEDFLMIDGTLDDDILPTICGLNTGQHSESVEKFSFGDYLECYYLTVNCKFVSVILSGEFGFDHYL